MASCPEKRTKLSGFPVTCAKAIAKPATASRGQRHDHKRTCDRRRVDQPANAGNGKHRDRHDERKQDRPREGSDRRGVVLRECQRGDCVGTGAETGHAAHADEDQRADTRGQQAREQDDGKGCPTQAGRLDDDHRTDDGGAEERGDRREARGCRHEPEDLIRGVLPGESHGQNSEAPAERDEWCLGAKNHSQANSRERREENPGQLDGLGGGPGLQTFGGLVSPSPGQPGDGEGDRDRGDGQYGQRPPGRNRGEVQRAREILVDPQLKVVNELEVAPRNQGHQKADDRSQYKEDLVILGAEQRGRIGWNGTGWGCLSHARSPTRREPSLRPWCGPPRADVGADSPAARSIGPMTHDPPRVAEPHRQPDLSSHRVQGPSPPD